MVLFLYLFDKGRWLMGSSVLISFWDLTTVVQNIDEKFFKNFRF